MKKEIKLKFSVLVTAPPILPKILKYRKIMKDYDIDLIRPDFDFKECLSENQLLNILNNFDGIICGDDKLSKKVLEKTDRLKVISKWGTGIDSIDAKFAESHGIKVHRVTGVFADPVADSVLTYILLFSRKVLEKHNLVKNHSWHKVNSLTLREQKLGIIGVGHIGTAVVKRARSFGMKVYGYDIKNISHELVKDLEIEMTSLENLLKLSDFVSLNCELNTSSYHIIND